MTADQIPTLPALPIAAHFSETTHATTPTMSKITNSHGTADVAAPLAIDTLLPSHSSGNSRPAGSNESDCPINKFDSQIKRPESSRAHTTPPSEAEPIFPVFTETTSQMTIKAFAPSGDLAGKLMEMISESDDARLARNETRISQGLASFVEVGEALSDIRDARLYRATHGTFESYCAEKWGMSRNYCTRLMTSADVAKSVPIGTVSTESQARELARVEPARREEVIRKADIATGGKITAAAIKEAAVEVVEPIARERPRDRFEMPPRALFLARGAIHELGKIQRKDRERIEALTLVIEFCTAQIKLV